MNRIQKIFPWRTLWILALGIASFEAIMVAQKNSSQPQPRADKLAPISGSTRGNAGVANQPDGVMPTVPAGFTVSVYAEVRAPRLMVYAPNGDLFVSSPATNTITVLRDANNDGIFEQRSVFAGADNAAGGRGSGGSGGAPRGAGGPPRGNPPAPAVVPTGPPPVNPEINGPLLGASAPACTPPGEFVHSGPGTLAQPFGLAFNKGFLYVGNTGSIVRYKYTDGDLVAQGPPEKIMDLPTGGHSTRNIVFNRAGTKMYVAVGSGSNNNAGEDCRRAAVLEFNPDGSGYRVFASGIRNPVGLTLQPGTDIPWVAINERDNLGDDLVPDYATSVKDGGFYGWPYSYIGKNPDPRYVGAFPELVNRGIVPDVLIPAHSAALGIAFYTATQFPQHYRSGAFVALHGSWNRAVAAGYKVAFFPMVNGKPGPLEDFMTGLLAGDGSSGSQILPWARPVGITVARDGSLLISDDAPNGNKIWKVSATSARRGN
jgi:glucose/arabinose dehydrogenase